MNSPSPLTTSNREGSCLAENGPPPELVGGEAGFLSSVAHGGSALHGAILLFFAVRLDSCQVVVHTDSQIDDEETV
jgi:hypothetical protein